jgi:hypothetical protein
MIKIKIKKNNQLHLGVTLEPFFPAIALPWGSFLRRDETASF